MIPDLQMIPATLRRLFAPQSQPSLRRAFLPNGVAAVALPFAAVAVAATMAAALAPAGAHAQTVDIRYNFSEGMDVRYEMVQSTSTPFPGMGDMHQEQTQVLRMQVISVDAEGNARIRQSIESIRMEATSPMGTQSYDSSSDQPLSDPALAPLAALVGSGTELVIGPDGGLVDAGDLGAWMREILEGADPEVRAQFESSMSEEALETMLSQWVQSLPPNALAPGERWEQTVELPLPFGTLSSTSAYTLDGVETRDGEEVATLQVSGTIGELDPDPSNPMAEMVSVSGGEMNGSMEFSVSRGLLLGSDLSTTMNMEMMGQSIRITSRVRMRLLP